MFLKKVIPSRVRNFLVNYLYNQRPLWRILKFLKKFQKYYRQLQALSILFIVILLDLTLFNYFLIFNVKPDVILATLIIFSAFFSLKWLAGFALLGGIFRDSMSMLPLGFNTVICILWVILARRMSQKFTVENIFIRSALLCAIILLNNLSLRLVIFVLGGNVANNIFLKIAIMQSVLTLLLALPMYKLFAYLLTNKPTRIAPEARYQ